MTQRMAHQGSQDNYYHLINSRSYVFDSEQDTIDYAAINIETFLEIGDSGGLHVAIQCKHLILFFKNASTRTY